MNKTLTRIIAAGTGRKSRLHDEKGNFIGINRLLFNVPRAISSGLLRIGLNYRPELPWISYSAIKELEKNLTKKSRVLEFGSGMSTIWYARHSGEVYSVEDCKPWFEKIGSIIIRNRIGNIHLFFSDKLEEYSKYMTNDSVGFDLIMVDGNYRGACVAAAITLLKPGGIFYLDNSDRGIISDDTETRLAESIILEHARVNHAEIIYYTDFAPTTFFAQQGLMLKMPRQKQ